MYSFFEIGGRASARILAATGAAVMTIALLATAIIPASPASPFFTGTLI